MNKIVKRILIIILFAGGLSLLLYPFVANQWNNYRQSRLISDYDQTVADREAAGEIDYQAEKEAAVSYNNDLLPSILPDSFAIAEASEEDSRYMSCLNIAGNGMMGTVEIPKIEITLPVYHTTADDILQIAAGHLEGSSLPVGGEDTHSVISAHRGLPSAALFTDLDKLEETDHFLLHILDETLCYEVDKITVIEPEDTDDLKVEAEKDLVTLMTCTPYGVNSHRLLVRGHRVPYVEEELADEKLPLSNMSLHTSYLLWVFVGIAVAAVFIYIMYRREKKLFRKRQEEENSDVQTEIVRTGNGAEVPPLVQSEPEKIPGVKSGAEELPLAQSEPEDRSAGGKPSEEDWPYKIQPGESEWPDEVSSEDMRAGGEQPEADGAASQKEQP
ncbi:MAG: class C sortase [Eubacterium sp.]|nr:class C sortase [Eubacterium sp.]